MKSQKIQFFPRKVGHVVQLVILSVICASIQIVFSEYHKSRTKRKKQIVFKVGRVCEDSQLGIWRITPRKRISAFEIPKLTLVLIIDAVVVVVVARVNNYRTPAKSTGG